MKNDIIESRLIKSISLTNKFHDIFYVTESELEIIKRSKNIYNIEKVYSLEGVNLVDNDEYRIKVNENDEWRSLHLMK